MTLMREMNKKKEMHVWAVVFSALILLTQHRLQSQVAAEGFIRAKGLNFVLNRNKFLANGFNAYWLMMLGSDPSQKSKVTSAFREASGHGLSVGRTWAFSDGGSNPLQYSPGSYNENMFKGLDFALAEARKYNIRLILSLVNNYDNMGGRKQYVEWGRTHGQTVKSEDDFYTNSVIKGFYKKHVKTVLTRINSLTGIAYKDDPTIFAWELMNEPRCQSDQSGRTIQGWITEMAGHVKSIDRNHLLEAGLEGFYGPSSMQNQNRVNPKFFVGTDFISNNQIPGIDFATLHSYPDQWLSGSNDLTQLIFLNKWLDTHIKDSNEILQKPLLLTEFGKYSKGSRFENSDRDQLYRTVYNKIYWSARNKGSAAGGLFWQLLTEGMDSYKDGYEIILNRNTPTVKIISLESQKLHYLGKLFQQKNG